MRYVALAIVVAALMLPAPARAIPMTFGGILSGANEVPPVTTPGAGSVAVVLDPRRPPKGDGTIPAALLRRPREPDES